MIDVDAEPDMRSAALTPQTDGAADATDLDGRGFRLLVGVVVGLAVGIWMGWTPQLVVIGALALMILLHEFGHFVAAKRGGMKVTEFFIGFGPRLWSVRRGETEYGVKALPLGGYVRIVGMHNLDRVDAVDEPRSYRQASFPRRLAVAVAGSTMHALIALVLLVSMFAVVGEYSGRSTMTIDEVVTVPDGPSPAQAAGLRAGDRVISVDGRKLTDWNDFREAIQSHAGVTMHLVVARGGVLRTLTPTKN